MLPKTIEDFGGPYVDAKVVSNPTSQLAASKANRCFEDVAQMTRPAVRAEVHFTPGVSPTVTYHTSVWGSSNAEKPSVTHTGTGLYHVDYAVSFTDALGESETVSFLSGVPTVWGTADNRAQIVSIAANVITLRVRDDTGALSDLSSSETVVLWLR